MNVVYLVVIKKTSGFIGLAFTDSGLVANTNPKATKIEAINTMKRLVKRKSVMYVKKSQNETPEFIKSVADYVDQLWRGKKPKIVPKVKIDWSFLTVNERKVLETLMNLPRNAVISYAQLAEQAGLSKSHARFVGNVMARNPFPLIIPCHLVVKSDGSIGNYGYGSEMKEKLIHVETGR